MNPLEQAFQEMDITIFLIGSAFGLLALLLVWLNRKLKQKRGKKLISMQVLAVILFLPFFYMLFEGVMCQQESEKAILNSGTVRQVLDRLGTRSSADGTELYTKADGNAVEIRETGENPKGTYLILRIGKDKNGKLQPEKIVGKKVYHSAFSVVREYQIEDCGMLCLCFYDICERKDYRGSGGSVTVERERAACYLYDMASGTFTEREVFLAEELPEKTSTTQKRRVLDKPIIDWVKEAAEGISGKTHLDILRRKG